MCTPSLCSPRNVSEHSSQVGSGPLAEVRVSRVAGDERARAAELAVRLAAEVAGVRPDRLRLDHEPNGRPVVRGARVEVSVSHGRGEVAVAASTAVAVGVDVEVVRPLPAAGLARRWLRPDEAEWVGRCAPADRPAAFLWLWTQKEALSKAAGRGLAGGSGLLVAVRLPERWPPGDGLLADGGSTARLGGVPGRPDLAVAAGFAAGLVVAVAARGEGVAGAVVRIGRSGPVDPWAAAGVGADQRPDTA